jgi:hypothetical protein
VESPPPIDSLLPSRRALLALNRREKLRCSLLNPFPIPHAQRGANATQCRARQHSLQLMKPGGTHRVVSIWYNPRSATLEKGKDRAHPPRFFV